MLMFESLSERKHLQELNISRDIGKSIMKNLLKGRVFRMLNFKGNAIVHDGLASGQQQQELLPLPSIALLRGHQPLVALLHDGKPGWQKHAKIASTRRSRHLL